MSTFVWLFFFLLCVIALKNVVSNRGGFGAVSHLHTHWLDKFVDDSEVLDVLTLDDVYFSVLSHSWSRTR